MSDFISWNPSNPWIPLYSDSLYVRFPGDLLLHGFPVADFLESLESSRIHHALQYSLRYCRVLSHGILGFLFIRIVYIGGFLEISCCMASPWQISWNPWN